MPRVQLPAVTPKRRAWNKGHLDGQKRPLLPKQVWAIRARLELAGNLRDLALFNVTIASKLRGCDLVSLKVIDLLRDDRIRERVSVVQNKTNKPVQFELGKKTQETVTNWIKSAKMIGCQFLFPSRFHDRLHISARQYGHLVRDWVVSIGWNLVATAPILCAERRWQKFIARQATYVLFSFFLVTQKLTAPSDIWESSSKKR